MTIRKRPRKIAVRPFDTYRRRIPDAKRMLEFLTDTHAKGYLRVYFVRGKDLLSPAVRKALSTESRCRIAQLDDPVLLQAVSGWLMTHGGLTIYTTLHGELERLH